MAVQAWFEGLAGDWQLSRRISNGARFRGVVRFQRTEPDTLAVREEGQLRLPTGDTASANREWLWRLYDGRTLDIRYGADRGHEPYHLLSLADVGTGWRASASHICGEDCYEGVYVLRNDRLFSVQTVSGPNKDYRLFSRYWRDIS